MSSESLARLEQAGQLKLEPPSRKEFDRLLKSGRAYLAEKDLFLESRFDLAYAAAYAFSLPRCALAATGARTATSCSSACRTRWGSGRSIGGYSRFATNVATLRRTRASSLSMRNS